MKEWLKKTNIGFWLLVVLAFPSLLGLFSRNSVFSFLIGFLNVGLYGVAAFFVLKGETKKIGLPLLLIAGTYFVRFIYSVILFFDVPMLFQYLVNFLEVALPLFMLFLLCKNFGEESQKSHPYIMGTIWFVIIFVLTVYIVLLGTKRMTAYISPTLLFLLYLWIAGEMKGGITVFAKTAGKLIVAIVVLNVLFLIVNGDGSYNTFVDYNQNGRADKGEYAYHVNGDGEIDFWY